MHDAGRNADHPLSEITSRTSTECPSGNTTRTPRFQSSSPKGPSSFSVITERSLYLPAGANGNRTRASEAFDLFRRSEITPLPLRARRAKPSQAAGVVWCQLPSGKKLSLIFVVARSFLNHAILW